MNNDDNNKDKQTDNSKQLKTVLCFCVAIVAIVAAYYLGKTNGAAQCEHQKPQTDSIKYATMVDSSQLEVKETEVAETTNNDNATNNNDDNRRQSIKEEFIKLLKDNDTPDNECYYFLYDINRDNIPEIWIKRGNCEADYGLVVYTFQNGIKKLYDDGAGHTCFYKGKDYILQVYAHMGVSYWSKLSYKNGKIAARIIFEENIIDTDRDYKQPQEKEIALYPSSNLQPIYDL